MMASVILVVSVTSKTMVASAITWPSKRFSVGDHGGVLDLDDVGDRMLLHVVFRLVGSAL
jgi:hypothetical protein